MIILIRWLCQDTRPWRRSESERSIAGPVAQTKPRSTQRVRNGVAAQDSAGARRFLLARRPFHETCSPFGASENWASAPHSAFSIPALDPPGQRVSPFPIHRMRASVPLPFNAVTGGVRTPLALLRFAMQFPAQANLRPSSSPETLPQLILGLIH